MSFVIHSRDVAEYEDSVFVHEIFDLVAEIGGEGFCEVEAGDFAGEGGSYLSRCQLLRDCHFGVSVEEIDVGRGSALRCLNGVIGGLRFAEVPFCGESAVG